MKIALVAPPWLLKNDYQPLGVGYLSALLEAAGHSAPLFDFTLSKNESYPEMAEEVMCLRPDLVGVTITTNTHSSALRFIGEIKKIDPAVPVVVGGPHPTLFPEEMLLQTGIDYAVFGEGEYTLLELVQRLGADGDLASVKGLAYRTKDNQVVKNQARCPEDDLNRLPFPSRKLVNVSQYPYSHSSSGRRLATILSSRGCPFNCPYCYKGIFGTTYRQRSVESILSEIRHLVAAYGVTFFYFIDDLFIFDHARIREFSRRVIQENISIEWQCLGRVDLVNPEILKAMRASGCVQVFYGIESGNKEIIKNTKGVTLEQVRLAVGWAKDAGIRVSGYFMLGLPDDTLETMRQTLDFSSELGLEEAMFSIATPFPGTGLWEKMLCKDAEKKQVEFDSLFYHGNPRKLIFNVSNASEKEVLDCYRKARVLSSQISDRHLLIKRFGKNLGFLLFTISKIPFIRAAGKTLYRLFFLSAQGQER